MKTPAATEVRASAGAGVPGRSAALLRLARPGDWVKNVLVFPALLASGLADKPEAVAASLVAFVAFCLTASGVYAVNDAIDWRRDLDHPVKRRRPIPAGEIRPATAWSAGFVSIAAAFALVAFALEPAAAVPLAVVLLAYLLLQVGYNLGLKRLRVVDVTVLAIGFVLRALAGAVSIGVPASLWLLSSVLALCLFLAFVKRACDVASARRAAGSDPESGEWRPAAGYVDEAELHWGMGVSAAVALLTFLMYAMSDHALIEAGRGVRGFVLLTPLVIIALFRMHAAATRGRDDSPVRLALADPVILVATILFVLGAAACLYLPGLDDVLATYFLIDG